MAVSLPGSLRPFMRSLGASAALEGASGAGGGGAAARGRPRRRAGNGCRRGGGGGGGSDRATGAGLGQERFRGGRGHGHGLLGELGRSPETEVLARRHATGAVRHGNQDAIRAAHVVGAENQGRRVAEHRHLQGRASTRGEAAALLDHAEGAAVRPEELDVGHQVDVGGGRPEASHDDREMDRLADGYLAQVAGIGPVGTALGPTLEVGEGLHDHHLRAHAGLLSERGEGSSAAKSAAARLLITDSTSLGQGGEGECAPPRSRSNPCGRPQNWRRFSAERAISARRHPGRRPSSGFLVEAARAVEVRSGIRGQRRARVVATVPGMYSASAWRTAALVHFLHHVGGGFRGDDLRQQSHVFSSVDIGGSDRLPAASSFHEPSGPIARRLSDRP